jgi:cytochrome b
MSSSETIRATSRPASTLVWDPVVRFGHWALVAAFAVAYLSAEEEAGGADPLHVWGGYVVGAIVVGAMVIALLVCLAATVATGLISYGEEGKGPLAVAMVTDTNANSNDTEPRAPAEKRGGETESTIGELHGLMANITVALVVAHIFGVAVASLVHKENLVLAMITGRKRRAHD